MTKKHTFIINSITSESDVRSTFRLVKQLRPHLLSEDEFWERWQRQTEDGYMLDGLFDKDGPAALAGYRVQQNFVHGRFLYVDDLITDEEKRGCGYGESMMVHLIERARATHCNRLVLDTPLSNSLGQRFYFRCGLLATSLRFSVEV